MNNTFTTSLDFMTKKHYIEQPMLSMVERIISRKFFKNNELKKTLDDIDLTLHMGPYEHGIENVYVSNYEDEKFQRFSVGKSNMFSFSLMILYSYSFVFLKT